MVEPPGENYAHPKICFFHVLFKAASLAFYILSTIFVDSFVIIFVVTVLLAALDFWVVKNVSGRILVGLRWWNEINDLGESVWRFECLDQESLARMNKKDSWLFWWTLYLALLKIIQHMQTSRIQNYIEKAVVWILLGIFSLVRFQADYLLVVGVCLTLSLANIIGFTKCRKVILILAFISTGCPDIPFLIALKMMPRSRFRHLPPRPSLHGFHPHYSRHSAWSEFSERKMEAGKWVMACTLLLYRIVSNLVLDKLLGDISQGRPRCSL
ncbi:Golgi apparatus membrane protein-like protein ECHIDNA [Vitis vinifera]|uniref:Golgi apparatus membrane protein TVP23 n=1 Tax=Vitis vinifera TaxID=29760 RepID=A0A438CG08_VITVI|nr:Golgi apparatus membrane protein-like protein ECHIDNA [Vitis vinifera]RVW39117.1 Golgi apparatus membrane protein-like protein ECHIDNA [Vitis vinifera]